MISIADHLGRWFFIPRHKANGVHVWLHINIDGAVAHRFSVGDEAAIDGEGENFFGHAQALGLIAGEKFFGRQNFSTRCAGHIGDEAFNLANVIG